MTIKSCLKLLNQNRHSTVHISSINILRSVSVQTNPVFNYNLPSEIVIMWFPIQIYYGGFRDHVFRD